MQHRNIYCEDKKELVDLFVGKSVTKINDHTLLLSDGQILEIMPNEGCGGCSEGWYDIDELNECENIITNVEVDVEGYEEVFHLFVYAENRKINLLTVSGHDNGYYGTGYWINVTKK